VVVDVVAVGVCNSKFKFKWATLTLARLRTSFACHLSSLTKDCNVEVLVLAVFFIINYYYFK
jgi:hypothetical protein